MGEWPPLSAAEIRTIQIQKFRRHIGASTEVRDPWRASLVDPDMVIPTPEERGYIVNFQPKGLT